MTSQGYVTSRRSFLFKIAGSRTIGYWIANDNDTFTGKESLPQQNVFTWVSKVICPLAFPACFTFAIPRFRIGLQNSQPFSRPIRSITTTNRHSFAHIFPRSPPIEKFARFWLFKARLSQPKNFHFSFVTLPWNFLFILFCLLFWV